MENHFMIGPKTGFTSILIKSNTTTGYLFGGQASPQMDTPPHWKQAIVTTIGVYVVSATIIKLLGLFSLGWNFFVENFFVSALVVGSLTWTVMPFLTRVVFRKWLYK